ncbi:endonuclease/exonuclease/phosphatase family protein [Halobellus litoreus]|uniref:Endonuclease/exonuclease/phosphatase family protein n=1 Tax=Halobellus litoreus TaxID=755310 RepID=A0ABD6DQI9_9EURY
MDEIPRSRRQLLRTGGRALAGASLLSAGAVSAAASGEPGGAASGGEEATDAESFEIAADGLTVATQNLGLGADFLSIARADTDAPIPERVGSLYADVRNGRPRARMAAVADALGSARPTVVGVQEAALVRRGPRSGGDPADPDADEVVVDFLAALLDALDARDAPYAPAAVATNADLEFPGRVDGDALDVRLTDRDAILVREDGEVAVAETRSATYDASLTLPIGAERTVEIERGYALATLQAGRVSITVANTHLEAGLESVRAAQAKELADALSDVSGSVVLLGDLNDGPSGTEPDGGTVEGSGDGTAERSDGVYGMLTELLSDATDGEIGGTCCRPSSFRPPDEDGLTRRIDHVLARYLTGADSRRLGVETFATDDGTQLWPSDHAGVLVELSTTSDESTTEASPTSDSNRTASGRSDEQTGGSDAAGSERPTTATGTPGFGVGTAAAALVGVAGGARLRRWLRRR